MPFASLKFLAFIVPVLLAYWLTRGRQRLLVLLAANYVFYAWWDHRLVWVLLASTALNFLCGQRVDRSDGPTTKRAWLAVSLVGGLGLLAWFKYHNFFAENLVSAAGLLGWRLSPLVTKVLLPMGISYFTFQGLSYVLDIHRGVARPARSLLVFATFASFFPHIVAGPLTRGRQLIPQLDKGANFEFQHLEVGLQRILFGLFKKLLVADTLAQCLVNPAFADPARYSSGTLALALVGYAVQVYADFSGYSSMAIGVARLLGLKLPENFRFPYLSLNIAEFWRRWHITLSRWLRDYLWWSLARNLPFEGNLRVRLRSLGALFVVFVVCGIWHGAAWTFVAWGALHGTYVVVYEIWHRWRVAHPVSLIPRWAGILLAWITTQVAVVFSWLLFRSGEFSTLSAYLRGLVATAGSASLPLSPSVCIALLALPVDHLAGWLLEHRPEFGRRIPVPVRAAAYVVMIVFLQHARPEQASPFIYFRF